MGIVQTLASKGIQIGSTKIFFNDFKMPFKNVHHFWIKVEASTKNGSHFCRTYLDFELIQTYLNWSYLNAIYILDAPKMLEIVKGHWNNSESTHNYFQDFMNGLLFISNQNRKTEIRKGNRNKRERQRSYLGLPGAPTGPPL